ncbi:MAG: TRAP transporter small permease, partial [Limnochordia bacterium]
MKRLVHWLEAIQGFFGVVLFTSLTAVVFLQVLTRYVFHSPVLWSEEMARFLFFWTALTGASISVKNQRHFVIEVFSVDKIKNPLGKRL